jgi:hypothetical protein
MAWLKQVHISQTDPSTPLDQFLQAIRDAAAVWLASPLSSPPGDFMFGSPPGALVINVVDAMEYFRAAFRVWVTELRPRWIARWHGCAAAHIEGDAAGDEDCVLLAQLDVPLLPLSPGTWDIPNETIPVNQNERPFLVHLRLLQEWALASIAMTAGALSGGGGEEFLLQPPNAPITNLDGPISLDLKNEQIVIANSTAGVVRMTLPPTAGQDGRLLVIKRISTGSQVQIAAGAGDLVEGQASLILTAQNRFVQLVANEKLKAWHVIAQ